MLHWVKAKHHWFIKFFILALIARGISVIRNDCCRKTSELFLIIFFLPNKFIVSFSIKYFKNKWVCNIENYRNGSM